jgi:hypothetical protein
VWQPITWVSVLMSSVGPVNAYQSRVELRAARRLSRVGWMIATTQLLSVVVAVGLIAGLPFAAWKRGPMGFLWALAAVLLLSLIQSILVYAALARLATPLGARLRSAASCLWPFHAMRAGDRILVRLVGGQVITTMRRVFGDELLVETWRASLYDALSDRKPSRAAEAVLSAAGADRVSAVLRRPAGEVDAPRCLRCGASFRAELVECTDCGVPLEPRLPLHR